jgi:hypothetical protein
MEEMYKYSRERGAHETATFLHSYTYPNVVDEDTAQKNGIKTKMDWYCNKFMVQSKSNSTV